MILKKIIFWFSSFVMFITFVSGALFLIVLAHEYTHYFDFKGEVNEETDSMCLLANPLFIKKDGIIGYYSYEYNQTNERVKEIMRYTEFKAYSVSVIVLILILFSYLKFLGGLNE